MKTSRERRPTGARQNNVEKGKEREDYKTRGLHSASEREQKKSIFERRVHAPTCICP